MDFDVRLGYQMVTKPIQNTVVIDLSSTKPLASCLDETQTSSLKVNSTGNFSVGTPPLFRSLVAVAWGAGCFLLFCHPYHLSQATLSPHLS